MQSAEEFFESRRVHPKNMGFTKVVAGNNLADESQKLNCLGFPDAVMLPAASEWLDEIDDEKPFLLPSLLSLSIILTKPRIHFRHLEKCSM